MTATAAGQAVDAGAGRVGLAAGTHRLAVGQIKARKLCGLQGVDVAWQFVIVVATVLSPTLWTTTLTTAFRTWSTGSGTALAIAPVVKARVAALILAATTVTVHAFAATVPLAFKTRCTLGCGAA